MALAVAFSGILQTDGVAHVPRTPARWQVHKNIRLLRWDILGWQTQSILPDKDTNIVSWHL